MSSTENTPVPQGHYRSATRDGDQIFTSGMTPRQNGVLLHDVKIRADDPLDQHREAVRLATMNAIDAAISCLAADEAIGRVLLLNVYLRADEGFNAHAKLGDFASEAIVDRFGRDCIGSRVTVGVHTLPSNATVEVSLIARIGNTVADV